MAKGKVVERSSGISPTTLVVGAVGLGLVAFGIYKLYSSLTPAHPINAKFNFDHVGLETDVKFRVRFGNSGPFGVFNANPDLVRVSQAYRIPASEEPTPQEYNLKIMVPAKKALQFQLPYTYDGEAMILDANGDLIGDLKVVTENVFTHGADFEVTML